MNVPSTENNWAANNEHKTITMPLKTIDVDVEIVPVVKWLNDMRQVFTLWSCQGNEPKPVDMVWIVDGVESRSTESAGSSAYVMFLCRDNHSIKTIKKAILDFGPRMAHGESIELSCILERTDDLLNMVWHLTIDRRILPAFCEFVKSHQGEDE